MTPLTQAQAEDIPAIAGLLVRTWQRCYRGILPDPLLDALSVDHQAHRHRQYLAKGIPYFLARHQAGPLLGFASFGPAREPAMGSASELYTLYVDMDHQRKGIGLALLQAVERAAQAQSPALAVSVLKKNPYRAFYEKNAFQTVAELPLDLGAWQETSLILRKEFSP